MTDTAKQRTLLFTEHLFESRTQEYFYTFTSEMLTHPNSGHIRVPKISTIERFYCNNPIVRNSHYKRNKSLKREIFNRSIVYVRRTVLHKIE